MWTVVPEMTYKVSSGTLNSAHSLTHSLSICELNYCSFLFLLMLSFWVVLGFRVCYNSLLVMYPHYKVLDAVVVALEELVE